MKRRDWWLTAGGLIGGWLFLTAAVQDAGIPKDLVGGSGTLALVLWGALGGVKLWRELKGEPGEQRSREERASSDEALYLARKAGDALGEIAADLRQQTALLSQLVTEGREYHAEGRRFISEQRRQA